MLQKHEVPLSAIPCLQYRRALETEVTNKQVPANNSEQNSANMTNGKHTVLFFSLLPVPKTYHSRSIYILIHKYIWCKKEILNWNCSQTKLRDHKQDCFYLILNSFKFSFICLRPQILCRFVLPMSKILYYHSYSCIFLPSHNLCIQLAKDRINGD